MDAFAKTPPNGEGGATVPSGNYKAKQMIVMRRDLKMRKGKIAAQAGHACVEAVLLALVRDGRLADVRATPEQNWIYLDEGGAPDAEGSAPAPSPLADWFDAGVAKVCVYVDSEEELLDIHRRARELGFVSALIRDAGHTEFHGEPTYTCLALEPLYADQVDPLTGELPLY